MAMSPTAPPLKRKPKPNDPAPKTTTADTAPTWDNRLNALRLTKGLRDEVMGYVRNGLQIAAKPRHDAYEVKVVDFFRRFSIALVEYEMADFPACEVSRSWIFEHLPAQWKRRAASQSYQIVQFSGAYENWHVPTAANVIDLPLTYCRSFGRGQGGPWASFHPEAAALCEEQRVILADVDEAARSIRRALDGCSKMGDFLRTYPAAIELVRGSFLAELAQRAGAPPSNVMRSPVEVMCGIAKVKGLVLPECGPTMEVNQ